MRLNATAEQITALLREGLSNTAIAKQLHCDRHRVGDTRRDLRLANVPAQPLTLVQKWAANTVEVDGGHLKWTGERASGGTPVLRYWPKTYTAAAVAFRVKHKRDPDRYVRADCGMKHCVAPEHVDDTATRQRTREQLRYLTGGTQRPATCRHGHDQAQYGRYESDGSAYCEKCKVLKRRARRAS